MFFEHLFDTSNNEMNNKHKAIMQEALNERMKADGLAISLSQAKWSAEERKELDAKRQHYLERYRALLNN